MTSFEGHKVLVIDPATTSGYCIVQHYQSCGSKWDFQNHVYSGECEISQPQYFTLKASKEGDHTGNSCNQIYYFFLRLALKEEITMIAMEDYIFSRFAKQGAKLNVAIRSALQMLADDLKIPYIIIPIALWKRTVSGRGRPSKEEKNLWGKAANKRFIAEALKKYGIYLPEKIQNAQGRMVNFKYDLSDVIGQAICIAKIFFKSKVIVSFWGEKTPLNRIDQETTIL